PSCSTPSPSTTPFRSPVPVVLEPLRGIDAAHLPETAGVRGPQLARRRVADRPVALDVPRPCPVTDDDVGDEGPFASSGVLARVAPRPAEPGGHPGGASALVLVAQQILHLLRGLHERHLEVVVARPRLGGPPVDPEEPQHPLLVLAAPAAAELLVQRDVLDVQSLALGVGADL